MKTIWFGSSCSLTEGLGHLSRCIAIAEEMRIRNFISCFKHLSKFDERGLDLLRESGFTHLCVCEGKPTLQIIDSYSSNFIENCIGEYPKTSILLVDEISPRVRADYYIEASPVRDWEPANKQANIFKFDRNPILRKMFDEPVAQKALSSSPKKVLVSLGATKNEFRILDLVIPVLHSLSFFDLKIGIISNNSESNRKLADKYAPNLKVLSNVSSLRNLLKDFDFVISGGGVTAWELISLNTPGILIGVVSNQFEQVKYLQDHDLRVGLIFQDSSRFQSRLLRKLTEATEETSLTSKNIKLRNGREEVVHWILDVMKYSEM